MSQKHIDALGPVILYWIAQLHDKLAFLAETRGRKALYCARAGKRIEDLMQAYTGGTQPFEAELFGISRIAACKVGAGFAESFALAHEITSESLRNITLADLCRAYLQHEWDETHPQMAALARLRQPYDRNTFRSLVAANDPAACFFRDRLLASHHGLRDWLAQGLLDGTGQPAHTGYVLVDSGWKGSIQAMLQNVFPQYGFEGLYFGVMDTRPMADRYGIVFDSLSYVPGRPETVFAAHRHLIETLLEPHAPSVEEVAGGPLDAVARAQLDAVRNETPLPGADALFLALRDYVAAHAGMPLDEILVAYRAALPALVPMILTPTREDAEVLAGKDRSIDFGRKGEVPVLATGEGSGRADDTPDRRIQRALWPQGQIALEYEGPLARQLQERVSGIEEQASFFAAHEKAALSAPAAAYAAGKAPDWAGSVAVVTRTKNRPLLFARAARSVAQQSWTNYQWVVVNDGGESAPVRRIIAQSGVDPARITLVDNPESVGMEAASNMGVRAVDTEFVVIHDDDDQWEPDFLKESVAFLQSPRACSAGFEGVLSRAWRVSEQIDGDSVIIHKTEPYMPWVSEVALTQMAAGNFFAPISFLYRRWVYDDIGGYDESLPVLGDWRFNLDFLIRTNIGFLDRYLAHYHHRDMGDSTRAGVYANSVVGGRSLHAQYFSVVTNGLLRDPRTPPALATIMAQAHLQRLFEQRFNNSDNLQRQTQARLEAGLRTPAAVDAPEAEDPPKADLPGTGALKTGLSDSDHAHLRAILLPAGGGSLSPKRMLARLRWHWRLARLGDHDLRREWLPRYLAMIPSAPDFDHLGYLQQHPEIWATKYNGRNELLPYHHFLLEGAAQNTLRPTLPEAGEAAKG